MNAIHRKRYTLPALAACLFCFAAPASAEPLTTAGIGVASCEKLAKDMNPAEGFNNTVNSLIFYWVQGYMSAANIALLEGDSQYVDLSRMDEKKLLPYLEKVGSAGQIRSRVSGPQSVRNAYPDGMSKNPCGGFRPSIATLQK